MDKSALLNQIPESLRDELLEEYNRIARNYLEQKWEPSELNGGKFCEVVYSILDGYIKGKFPERAFKPRNMLDSCRRLEQSGERFPRSIRIHIPRLLVVIYEVRNNRGVGHVGGDLDPNSMDATWVFHSTRWILCELVRVFHNVDMETAQKFVDSMSERIIPIIWDLGEHKMVLAPKMSKYEQTILLLYQSGGEASITSLRKWTEHSNRTKYVSQVIKRGAKERLWYYDKSQDTVRLSPLGAQIAEDILTRNKLLEGRTE